MYGSIYWKVINKEDLIILLKDNYIVGKELIKCNFHKER